MNQIIVGHCRRASDVKAGGGEWAECPWYFSPGNFCWPTGKREARKNEEWRRKEGKSKKGRWKIENGRGKCYKMRMRKWGKDYFFSFLFFFFCFSLFKTTEICFGSTETGIFYREKSISRREKIKKNDCPLCKIFLLRLWEDPREGHGQNQRFKWGSKTDDLRNASIWCIKFHTGMMGDAKDQSLKTFAPHYPRQYRAEG